MRTLASAVAALVIVAVIGFALARLGSGGGGSGDSPSPLSNRAATSLLGVSYPADWRRLSPPPTELLPPLGAALALAPQGTGRELVIGTTSASASSGQAPTALLRALSAPPKGEIVTLDGRRFHRYLDLSPSGQGVTESLYLLATAQGTIGAVCAAQTPSPAFTATCERVLATLRVGSGSAPAAARGVDRIYAQRLNAIVAKLNRARSTAGPDVGTGSLQARAQAAQRLGTAHAQAAAAAAALSPAGAGGLAGANRALVSALNRTAAAYRALGSALTERRQAAYRAAQTEIAAGARALEVAYARLGGLGYRTG